VMARRALERADVTLLVVDAAHGVTQGDATIATYAEQSGRSVILVMNKWDLAVAAARAAAEEVAAGDSSRRTTHGELRRTGKAAARWSAGPPARRQLRRAAEGETRKPGPGFQAGRLLLDYEELVRKKLKFLSYAPIVFLSASTGDRTEKLYPLIEQVAAARRRIPTPELNRWLGQVDLSRGTSPKARLVKIFYMMQASASPPTFLLFTNQKRPLHFSFERFLENQLRAKFDFTGTPVRFVQRLRKREQREKKERKAWKVR
jgi:GTPase